MPNVKCAQHTAIIAIHIQTYTSLDGLGGRTGANLPDQTGQEPSLGTSCGTGGCLLGSKLNAMICPVGMCCSIWQWKIHAPGFSTSKRMTAQLRRHKLIMSFSKGDSRF